MNYSLQPMSRGSLLLLPLLLLERHLPDHLLLQQGHHHHHHHLHPCPHPLLPHLLLLVLLDDLQQQHRVLEIPALGLNSRHRSVYHDLRYSITVISDQTLLSFDILWSMYLQQFADKLSIISSVASSNVRYGGGGSVDSIAAMQTSAAVNTMSLFVSLDSSNNGAAGHVTCK